MEDRDLNKLTGDSLMPIGKYTGVAMKDIPKEDLLRLAKKLKALKIIEGSPSDQVIKYCNETLH
jgi:hypothetical protein